MQGPRLLPLGVGDAFSRRWYSTCLLVRSAEHNLLVDCPHPIRKILFEATAAEPQPLDLDAVDAVVLTHLHGDHASGLEGLAWFSYFALGRPVRLAASSAVLERLWDDHLAVSMDRLLKADGGLQRLGFSDLFEPIALDLRGEIELAGFQIAARMTRHHVPTTALRISVDGAVLGYSADTSFDPSLIEWLSSADLIVHETNLGQHTPYEELAALPASLRDKMRLVHYTDEHDRQNSAIACLEQGREIPIRSGS